jgi:hypothetical protein
MENGDMSVTLVGENKETNGKRKMLHDARKPNAFTMLCQNAKNNAEHTNDSCGRKNMSYTCGELSGTVPVRIILRLQLTRPI